MKTLHSIVTTRFPTDLDHGREYRINGIRAEMNFEPGHNYGLDMFYTLEDHGATEFVFHYRYWGEDDARYINNRITGGRGWSDYQRGFRLMAGGDQ